MAEKLGLFFNEEVQQLIDSFAYCFKVKITVFSADMEELIVGLQNPGSRFCRMVQKKLRLRYRCCRQDKLMCERCGVKQELTVYHCYAGLSEAVVPIELEGALIGYGMLGQLRTSKTLPEEIKDAWKRAGQEQDVLEAAFLAQPFFDKPALDNMLRLFSMLVAYIVTQEYVKVRRPGLAENVVHWLDDHITETPDLDTVADAMNRSRSTISHTLKRQLGLSFKQLYILKRIQRFESIITMEPDISIREAAARVGYDDPYYFSRIYKKVRLAAPSVFIKSIRDSRSAEEKMAEPFQNTLDLERMSLM
ncbi:PocR ligand-binding domain-containing protein [Breznakiella homolactica]|uniref:PocR ligand-binding domain-containing protein n=1 Tax=Breznakiella homolactica TaxID=2798577 RepID=A0A7T7XNA6_9SPIR|nr:PocR ligand-binding domain-containing protein [Breznakiella homolactica]QQO09495.1 PocR ligand-binding domain-containing protein [Breznakiella homolactica]